MADLFSRLFGRYGHVSQHPRYKKDTKSYEWNLHVILDRSFGFLLEQRLEAWRWIESENSRVRGYLAGLIDSEGNVAIYNDKGNTALLVTIYNTDLELIKFAATSMRRLGYRVLGPYLDKPKGFRSPGYHIEMTKDYWKIVIARFEDSQRFLAELGIRHDEKMNKKKIALGLSFRQPWSSASESVRTLQNKIRSDQRSVR